MDRAEPATDPAAAPDTRSTAAGGAYRVVVAAGSLRADDAAAVRFPHRWTAGGGTVLGDFTGATCCTCPPRAASSGDLYREAPGVGVDLAGVRVTASGAFDTSAWTSTGITYAVELDSSSPPDRLAPLLELVDDVAEIPRALRAGAPVRRAT